MENVIVSVIVPIHGVYQYLLKCLESLSKQDFNLPYEVICINDSPIDDSSKIINHFVKTYPDIFKRIDVTYGDVSKVRNEGIKNSKGKYICFVDGDDYVYPNFLNSLYSLISNNNGNIGVINFNTLTIKGKTRKLFCNHFALKKPYSSSKAIKHLLGDVKIRSYCWNKIFKREFLIAHQIEFLNYTKFIEDFVFCFETFINDEEIYFSNEIAYCYRLRNDSISLSGNTNVVPTIKKFINALIKIKIIAIEKDFNPKELNLAFFTRKFIFFWLLHVKADKQTRKGLKIYFRIVDKIKKCNDIKELESMYLEL